MPTPSSRDRQRLEREHTVDAIESRLARGAHHSYLTDAVLGAVDGVVTTFAVVAGVAGAELPVGVALVLGLANLLADGVSMALGNFLGTRSHVQLVARVRRSEEEHIRVVPDGEIAELRAIFRRKGLSGDTLDAVVRAISQSRETWVDTMLQDEHGLSPTTRSPWRAGVVTFAAFVAVGAVPLLALLVASLAQVDAFAVSATLTGTAFATIGAIKGRIVGTSVLGSLLETLMLGGVAASIAYAVGVLLRVA